MAQELLRNRSKDARICTQSSKFMAHSQLSLQILPHTPSLSTLHSRSPCCVFSPYSAFLTAPSSSSCSGIRTGGDWRNRERALLKPSLSTLAALLLCILLQYTVLVYYVLFLPSQTTLRTGLLESSTPSRTWNEARRRKVYHYVIIKAKLIVRD